MLSQFHIRLYRPSDFPQVEKLWTQTDLGGSIRGDNNEVIARTIEAGGKFFILENHKTGELVGTSWITNDARRLYLHHFGIKPKYQKKGLSKLLLDASLDFVRGQKLQVKLEVHKSNSIATQLYQKNGFNFLGDYRVYIIRNIEE